MHISTKMRNALIRKVSIPEGVNCSIEESKIVMSKGAVSISRALTLPTLKVSKEGSEIVLKVASGNKTTNAKLNSFSSSLRSVLSGIGKKYVYLLESCNVHFPMTLKVDKNRLVINNFLGEKSPRSANIVQGAEVQITGSEIKVSSHDPEAAGQTAANIEIATKIKNRDRRVFQDGIFIKQKPVKELENA